MFISQSIMYILNSGTTLGGLTGLDSMLKGFKYRRWFGRAFGHRVPVVPPEVGV